MSAIATGGAVASALDALPAELPLAGGQANATLTLRPLLCAVMRGPRGWFERAPGRGAGLKALGIGVPAAELIDIPIVAFLLEHPTAGPVLVDTGFQRIVAEGPSRERTRNLGRVGRLMARDLRMEPRQCVAAQLQAHGIEESDLSLIVMTHLHFDHASALCDFPAATVLVSAPEWAAAHGRYLFMHGYVPAQLSPAPSYRTIEFEPGAQGDPFAHALDVFGDGSLRLVFTPGHTRGHARHAARRRAAVADRRRAGLRAQRGRAGAVGPRASRRARDPGARHARLGGAAGALQLTVAAGARAQRAACARRGAAGVRDRRPPRRSRITATAAGLQSIST